MQSIDSMHLFVHHDSPPPLWSRKPLLMSDGYLQPWANERDKVCALVGQRWRMFVGTKPFESQRSRSRWERVIRIVITTIDRNSIKFSDVQVGSVGHCVLPSSSRSKRSSCLRTAPAARASAPRNTDRQHTPSVLLTFVAGPPVFSVHPVGPSISTHMHPGVCEHVARQPAQSSEEVRIAVPPQKWLA